MPKEGSDPVGREITPAAQKAYDAQLYGPEQNLAGDKETAQRAAEYVARYIKDCEDTRTMLQDKLAVLYNLYNGEPVSNFFPTARSVHVPEPFKAVEAFVSRIVQILVGRPGWFRTVGIDDAGKKNRQSIQNLLMTQLRLDGFYTKIATFLRDCAIYGWCPGKTRWKFRRRKIRYNKLVEEPEIREGVEVGKKVRAEPSDAEINLDGPTLEHTDVYDFLTDLRFHDHQESPGCVYRVERTEDDVIEQARRGFFKNVKELFEKEPENAQNVRVQGPAGTALNVNTFRQLRNSGDGIPVSPAAGQAVGRLYEIFEFWGRFDVSKDEKGEEKEYVITLGRKITERGAKAGWVCLRVAEMPFWHGLRPALVAHFIRRSHCFQSIGLIEPITRLCAELDDSRNMALAARALAAKPLIVVDDGADLYTNQLVLEPGSVIRVRSTDSIRPLFIPDRSDAAYRAEAAIKADIQETTAVIKLFEGSPTEGGETATATISRVREANKRIAEVARNVAQHFLVPMLEMWHSMNQQMITEERLIEILGEDGLVAEIRKTGPEDVAGRVHFEIQALPQIEMAGIEARMRIGFLNAAAPFIMQDPGMIDTEALLRKTHEEMFGSGETDDIFPRARVPKRIRNVSEEHILLSHGHSLMPQRGENYFMHWSGHRRFMATGVFRKWDEDSKRRVYAHVANTAGAMQTELEQTMLPRGPMMGAPQGPQPGTQPQPRNRALRPPERPQMGPATPTGAVRSNIRNLQPQGVG